MATAASLLKGGILLLSSCNRSVIAARILYPPRPLHPILFTTKPPLISISARPLLNSINVSSNSKATARNVVGFCTATDATSVVDSSSSSAQSTEASSLTDPDAIKEAAGLLDIRVGKILKAWTHPDADSLYVEEVDIGEPEPRIICSGLVNYIPLDHLQDAMVVVLANLKPRNMRGIKSCGMLMAASDASHENIELLVPPEGSIPGERIWFGSENDKENQPVAATPNQIQKKKIWESVQPHLKTDASCTAMLGAHCMRTSRGLVVSKSLKNANIS
ncbi:hypothetical protein Ancab_008532 [Ancistrocladus abbreviatus]